jgi:hypothetical protein
MTFGRLEVWGLADWHAVIKRQAVRIQLVKNNWKDFIAMKLIPH